MRRFILSAFLCVLVCKTASAQQAGPQADDRSLSAPAVQPPTASEEIGRLKAAVADLQAQVNQLSRASEAKDSRPGLKQTSSTSCVFDQLPTELPGCPPPVSPASTPSWRLEAEWKNGLQVISPDEAFRMHVGGRLQFDFGWNMASQAVQFGDGGTGEFQDGAVFRRARIRIDGTYYSHFEFVTEFDFANSIENDSGSGSQPIGSPSFTNVWAGVKDLPVIGSVRAGWMQEPIGFESLTSSRWLNFMERSPGENSFFSISPGVMVRNTGLDERLTWAAGIFHVQNDNFGFGTGDGEYAETGRITWLPWYEDDGRQLVHLGIGATHRHLDNNQIELRGRPSVRTMPGTNEPPLADTGTIGGTTQETVDVELAGVFGPWTIQSEYFGSFIHDAFFPNNAPPEGVARGTLFYQGAYVELLYFLTGEYRAYDRKDGVFDRVVPLRDFNIWDGPCGWGAWQVGVRYGYLDLQNKGVNGATLNDMVFGVNWFLNPNMKIQWNLAVDHRESTPPGSSGWTYIFGSRLALDF
jgi:phosphate-selective porin OprO/OprP